METAAEALGSELSIGLGFIISTEIRFISAITEIVYLLCVMLLV